MRATGGLACLIALGASACYTGAARPFDSERLQEPGWVRVEGVPELAQSHEAGCGAAAAAMLLSYWGQAASEEEIRAASGASDERGLRAGFLRDYLRTRGLDAYLIEGTLADLERELAGGRPVIVGIAKPYTSGAYAHYQVVIGVNGGTAELVVIDPTDGMLVYSLEGFAAEWAPTRCLTIVAPGRTLGNLGTSETSGEWYAHNSPEVSEVPRFPYPSR